MKRSKIPVPTGKKKKQDGRLDSWLLASSSKDQTDKNFSTKEAKPDQNPLLKDKNQAEEDMVSTYCLSIDQTTKDQATKVQNESIENPKLNTDKVLPEIGESAHHPSQT